MTLVTVIIILVVRRLRVPPVWLLLLTKFIPSDGEEEEDKAFEIRVRLGARGTDA
jgi:hypothetical protein